MKQGQWFFVFAVAMGLALVFGGTVSCSQRAFRNEEPILATPSEPRRLMPRDEAPDTLPINDFDSSFFDFDRTTLRPGAKKALQETAAWLRKNPSVTLQIEGFCDERGSEAYNLRLGQRRADAVLEYLAAVGISRGRMAAVSYGRIPGAADSERAKNRRVSVIAVFPSAEEAAAKRPSKRAVEDDDR